MTGSAQTIQQGGADRPPRSDVSGWVGLAGLGGLFAWVALCRAWPAVAAALDLPGPRQPLDGPHAALVALLAAALPMVIVSLAFEKVHRNPSTGIDWSLAHRRKADPATSLTKIAGLWATFLILAGFYALCRWYWFDAYQFSMTVLTAAALPLALVTVPYVFWIDRVMVNPRDYSWHFGALVTGQRGWDWGEVKKHARAWGIKGFFTAFMISIVPFAFRNVVNADWSELAQSPPRLALMLIEAMFMIDAVIGTVGYIMTLRPLDSHIRSGNPFLGGWVAALICYPPFVNGILGDGRAINYAANAPGWEFWLQDHPVLIALWGAGLVVLTAWYAWATVAFGLRFSNITYRGVLTNGPYRITRHPAYVSKNLFWWCATLPFFVTAGGPAEAIRNSLFLLVVNGIYYWRARTEERHLLAEDPRYAEYWHWMARHGLLTAPLTRLGRMLRPAQRAPLPAE